MIGLIKNLLEKRKTEKAMVRAILAKKDFRHECPDCGAKGGIVLRPQITIIQYSPCEYCGAVKGFVIRNKRVFIPEN
ncbi:hypothetical protein EPN15_02850 [Patescibacteria group bacterium]|nr:MAG: hypothetical protein EPN15_02850 [Patescibacteria group bacterium]